MVKLFIIGTLLYYAVLLWRYRDSIGEVLGKRKKQARKPDGQGKPIAGNGTDLVGVSHYRLGQMRTNEDVSGQLSKAMVNASIFVPESEQTVNVPTETDRTEKDISDNQQPMDADFEIEYAPEETEVIPDEIEAEEIACFMGGESEMAQGITLAEMGQAIQVIQADDVPDKEERQAVQTIVRMEQTNLLKTMVAQIDGGRLRVAELMKKHETPVVAAVQVSENEELSGFDMNDFL